MHKDRRIETLQVSESLDPDANNEYDVSGTEHDIFPATSSSKWCSDTTFLTSLGIAECEITMNRFGWKRHSYMKCNKDAALLHIEVKHIRDGERISDGVLPAIVYRYPAKTADGIYGLEGEGWVRCTECAEIACICSDKAMSKYRNDKAFIDFVTNIYPSIVPVEIH
eukprot:CAMPEP_0169192788 /NCGR_PEP_ID=MMETSP1016-20121227/5818_1 /TAXON_ID=342587 /ORGANISM="Karlodinium micrum, Strain CCMP2283" /LENGTH=166 /DNA_ID=CAMNT_0009269185 /DNA_START=64 /DNA_END=564 /DNA_ORIENTATION=+